MKEKDISHIRFFLAKVGGLCQRLYYIDRKIINGGNNECSEGLELLLKLKSDVIKICVREGVCGRNCSKLIESEITDLLWSINIRIDILIKMSFADEREKSCFLEKYRNVYNPTIKSKLIGKMHDVIDGIIQVACTSEMVGFIIAGVLGILVVLLLQYLNIIVDETDNKYVILFTYVYFLVGKSKKISLEGIRFWKPKNWRENIRK